MKRDFRRDLHRVSEQMLKAGRSAGRKAGDIAREAVREWTDIWHKVLGENGHAVPHESQPSHDEIAVRAFEIWKSKGCLQGTSEEDWVQAERQLCHH